MKSPFFLLLLLPFTGFAQTNSACQRLLHFWEAGASINYPKNGGTAVGFKAAKNVLLLKEGLFAGVGAEAIRFQEQGAWYFPVVLNLHFLPLDKALGPALQFSPGYGFHRQSIISGNKTQTTTGGFTFYSGAGLAVGNALFTAGYSAYTFHTEGVQSCKGGAGIRLSVML